ncbi:hypothetical protein AB0G87_21885 [Streptomyces asoensis]|uniref:hypothetical protein n=1 Tax=Streptomyces asoensis TaxID=249586 RepID=UPI00340A5295
MDGAGLLDTGQRSQAGRPPPVRPAVRTPPGPADPAGRPQAAGADAGPVAASARPLAERSGAP